MRTGSIGGAQVVGRAFELLKLVGERTEGGHLIASLVTKSGLTRPTVYRILAALQAAGLIEQDEKSRRWHLGPEAFVIGTLAARRFNIERLAHDALIRIADQTGESTFLTIRRGNEAVCLIREEGTYPIRTHVLQAGDRLPLGVGSAGMAILAGLPDTEVGTVVDSLREVFRKRYSNYTASLVLKQVGETRKAGYSVNKGLLLPGSWGMGASVTNNKGVTVAALSITAIEARLPVDRQVELGRLLNREAQRLGARLHAAAE